MTNFWGDTDQETFGPWTGRWLVITHGDWNAYQHGEIAICREDFKHGFRSWGWDGPAKIIFVGYHNSEKRWNIMKDIAQVVADKLNEMEGI